MGSENVVDRLERAAGRFEQLTKLNGPSKSQFWMWLIGILVTLITSLVLVAVSFGSLQTQVSKIEKTLDKHMANTEVHLTRKFTDKVQEAWQNAKNAKNNFGNK